MSSEPVDVGGFLLWVSEIDGIRTIETRYPAKIDVSKLSTVISTYYDLWDDESPTINLTHIEQLEALNAQVRAVLKSVVQRTIGQDTFVGSAWTCGSNDEVGLEVISILRESGRIGTSVFATREEAIEYLRRCIAEWRSADRGGRGQE